MCKKSIIALLVAAMLLPSLASCGEAETAETQSTADTAASETVKETTAEESRNAISDDLENTDFGGRTFIFLGYASDANPNSFFKGFVVADELTGEIVNDAVYSRNLAIDERFNTKIHYEAPGTVYTDTSNLIKKSITAGDSDAFHLISYHVVENSGLAMQGYYMNWYDIPHVNFDKPWWSNSTVNDLTVNDICYLAVGDAAVSSISQTYCMLVNKNKLENYEVPNVYETVREGKWTIDYLREISTGMSQDVDGDGVMGEDDVYGFASNAYSNLNAYLWAFDHQIFQRNDAGELEFAYYSEKLVNIFDKLYSVFVETPDVYCPTKTSTSIGLHDLAMEMFKNSDCVFVNGLLSQTVTYLVEFEDVYGILPYPKFDENQANYKTMVDGNHEAMAIGKNAVDLDFIGTITEVLCAESFKQILPAYYDVCLKSRYADSPDDAEMIQLCVDTRVFDMGYVYDNWKGCSFWIETLIAAQKSKDIASHYQKNEKSATTYYEKVLAMFEEE